MEEVRLIDANALKKKAKMIDWLCNKQVVSVKDIDNAPTIEPNNEYSAIQYSNGFNDGLPKHNINGNFGKRNRWNPSAHSKIF